MKMAQRLLLNSLPCYTAPDVKFLTQRYGSAKVLPSPSHFNWRNSIPFDVNIGPHYPEQWLPLNRAPDTRKTYINPAATPQLPSAYTPCRYTLQSAKVAPVSKDFDWQQQQSLFSRLE